MGGNGENLLPSRQQLSFWLGLKHPPLQGTLPGPNSDSQLPGPVLEGFLVYSTFEGVPGGVVVVGVIGGGVVVISGGLADCDTHPP